MIKRIPLTASSALAVYEYIVTIDQEVSAVWKRPVSAASVLLVSIRWAVLLQALTAVLSNEASRSEVRTSRSSYPT